MMAGGSATNAFSFLVETLFHLYLVALMLRVLLEGIGADYYNPICQALVKVTDPVVRPLSKVLPRVGPISLAGLAALYIVQLLALVAVGLIVGWKLDPLVFALLALMRLIRLLLVLYLILIIIGVILSWVGHGVRHPIVPLIFQLTQPVLAPIRRVLPSLGGFDLSPLVAIILIQFLIILLAV
ncbi:YggT family protein [Wenzhouxiangella sp. AB-CW3]|uniref:YggT family protein n=1 Tax=Wenzhouxiangella sp. AB-CW3 TaxID=2771012 RepID=UPI00168A5E6D|nr:YggT family protein [Wenzhouxiangella sp. AB-CW3]QOC22421.1 YggT family protein [Wenzhouxiangella sp. AB-CW3]